MVEESKNLLEEKVRTLYVRWPKTIRDDKEVTSLFPENVKIKLPRQNLRCFHVVFTTIEEMKDCQKKMTKKTVEGKKIIFLPLSEKSLNKRKDTIERKNEAQKKVNISRPKKKSSVQSLFVTNIPIGTSTQEVKEAFPGCVSVALLKGVPRKPRSAVIKMSTVKFATAYLNNENPAPVIRNSQVKIFSYKKRSKALKKKLQTILKEIQDPVSPEIKEEEEEESVKSESEESES